MGKRRLAVVDGGSARQAGGPIDGTDLDAVVGVGRAKEVLLLAHGLAVGVLTGGGGGWRGRGTGEGLEVGPSLHPGDSALEMAVPIALSAGCRPGPRSERVVGGSSLASPQERSFGRPK